MLEVRQRPTGTSWRLRPCFSPDGAADFAAAPCTSEEPSHCCSQSGGICLSNGYCMDFVQAFAIWRGSCTDSTWNEANCPKACIGKYDVLGWVNIPPSLSAVWFSVAIVVLLLTCPQKALNIWIREFVCPYGMQTRPPHSIAAEMPTQPRQTRPWRVLMGVPHSHCQMEHR